MEWSGMVGGGEGREGEGRGGGSISSRFSALQV